MKIALEMFSVIQSYLQSCVFAKTLFTRDSFIQDYFLGFLSGFFPGFIQRFLQRNFLALHWEILPGFFIDFSQVFFGDSFGDSLTDFPEVLLEISNGIPSGTPSSISSSGILSDIPPTIHLYISMGILPDSVQGFLFGFL